MTYVLYQMYLRGFNEEAVYSSHLFFKFLPPFVLSVNSVPVFKCYTQREFRRIYFTIISIVFDSSGERYQANTDPDLRD